MLRSAGGACRALLGASGSLDIASTSVNGRVVAYAAMQQLVHSMLNRKWLLQQSHGPQRAASSTTSSAAAQPQAGVSPAPENAAMAPPNITLHDSAVKRLRELQAESPGKAVMLRVEVEGGGCSGFQYKFKLDSAAASDDTVIERDGVALVCDSVSLDFLRGAVVEYEDSLMRSAFQVASNPNSESTCGCGTSFVAKL